MFWFARLIVIVRRSRSDDHGLLDGGEDGLWNYETAV